MAGDPVIQTAECTCCTPARPIHREAPAPDDNTEWQHDDDAMFATVFHVHAAGGSSDCDGPHEYSHTYGVASLNWPYIFAAEPDRVPDDSDLWCQLVRMDVPCHAEKATVHIETGLMHWSEQTDEGHRGGSLQACTDPSCAHEGSTQRDVYAEMMGY